MPIEMVNETYVRKWTKADEAKLQELQARRAEIMETNANNLNRVLSNRVGCWDEHYLPAVINNADEIMGALRPFVLE